MQQKIKMIGMDLDGTLLNEKKELTAYSRKVLEQAIHQGVIVLVATGRPISGVPEELRTFPGMRYALTANGGRILDLKENKVIFESLVSTKSAEKILDVFEQYDTLKEKCTLRVFRMYSRKRWMKSSDMWRIHRCRNISGQRRRRFRM